MTHDVYGERILVGGSSFYASKILQALGASVSVATATGPDFRGADELTGIRVFCTPSTVTTAFENTYPEGRDRLMLVDHPASPVRVDCLPAEERHPDVLFLCPVAGEVDLDEWVAEVRPGICAAGLQGFLKTVGAPWPVDDTVHLAEPHVLTGRLIARDSASLSELDAVFLSVEDLRVAGKPEILDELKRRVAWVALTDGVNGATVFLKNEDRAFHVGIRKAAAVDPTGAGDAFASACLFGLASGMRAEDAARLGAATASLIVEMPGARAADNLGAAFDLMMAIPVRPVPYLPHRSR